MVLYSGWAVLYTDLASWWEGLFVVMKPIVYGVLFSSWAIDLGYGSCDGVLSLGCLLLGFGVCVGVLSCCATVSMVFCSCVPLLLW